MAFHGYRRYALLLIPLISLWHPRRMEEAVTLKRAFLLSYNVFSCYHYSLFRSNQTQKHIERHLHGIQKQQTVLVANKLEIDGMHNGPDLPGPLTGREQVILNFGHNRR